MGEQLQNRETGNGTVQQVPVADAPKFTLSEPDQIEDGNGDRGFTIFADKDVFWPPSRTHRRRMPSGGIAMAQALKDAIFIATSES
jgi:hypothetical protein